MLIGNIEKNATVRQIAEYLGGSYSFFQSIKRSGVGSPRIIYLEGLSEFDSIARLNNDSNYCNCEVYRQGIALRIVKKDLGVIAAIKFEEVNKIIFTTSPIRIRTRFGIVIRHRADVEIITGENKIRFHVLVPFYRSFKKFLFRNFDLADIESKILPIEDDRGAVIMNLLSKLVD